MKKSLSFAVSALASLPIPFAATSSNATDFDDGCADLIAKSEGNESAGMDVSVYSFLALSHDSTNDKADFFTGANLSLSEDKGVAVSLRKGLF